MQRRCRDERRAEQANKGDAKGTQISISETMHTVEHARGYTTISIER